MIPNEIPNSDASGSEKMNSGLNGRIRVLVVDDSVLMSRQIANILGDDEKIEVVGRAKDGVEALTMVETLKPDVVTMDVEMPRMNGLTALKHIMVRYSIPTVMISALTTEGARTTFDALKFGAIDVIAKPSRREDESLEVQKADIISKVKRAASIRTGRSRYIRMPKSMQAEQKNSHGPADGRTRFIGMAAGTGGYYALLRVIPALPTDFQDVLVAMLLVSNRYITPFVAYLDSHSSVPVKSIRAERNPERGVCYICSGEDGLVLEMDTRGRLTFKIGAASANGGDHPVDRLLRSLSACKTKPVGVVMTGSGTAGSDGLHSLRQAGGIGVVQDINNCLDPQMPLAALERDAAEKVLPDYLMAEFLTRLGSRDSRN
jgi:two-component system, chemotaxis family, protein-glutamate methylesterase/glutaminase